MFRAHVLIISRSKFYYTASGIITHIGCRFVHETGTYKVHVHCHLLYGGYMFRPFMGSSSGLLWNQVSECCVRVGISTVHSWDPNMYASFIDLIPKKA